MRTLVTASAGPPPREIRTRPSFSRQPRVCSASEIEAEACRTSAAAAPLSPYGTATSTSAEAPGASARSQARAPEACSKGSLTSARAGSSPATRWRTTPPCSNAAAPKPLGAVIGTTRLRSRPSTSTAPSAHTRREILLVPPIPWKACHGGLTWNGRIARKSRTARASPPPLVTW
ncbi:MAG: hypothetical protein IPK07_31465 [Deltaproteobacteria bacterium]|nr:hypothetical protein [Deltaproteobacteria bacterium]